MFDSSRLQAHSFLHFLCSLSKTFYLLSKTETLLYFPSEHIGVMCMSACESRLCVVRGGA